MKYLSGHEIRERFRKFFVERGHRGVASDSVVPKDDPTVLFTTAGMQQFKRQFLGYTDGFTRATTCQKCIRTDDLDEVGRTNFHHTFFEMLGNFSFGDYFKKEAIHWAWEFLTGELGIPAERLWVSVFHEDAEAFAIWRDEIRIPERKIFRLGPKSNFWPSNAQQNGPNGPCGPCSEIFFDYQPGVSSAPRDPDDEPGRFAEVWNLVFTQFNRCDGGVLEPLPKKNIDTGMGLERLTAVIQGVTSNFETDLFAPIFAAIDREIEGGRFKIPEVERRVLADHLRAVTFSIADGVVPSNKERGSVVKGLINNAANIALTYGADGACVYRAIPAVVEAMRPAYPELKAKAGEVCDHVRRVEEAFLRVRAERIPELTAMALGSMTHEERGAVYFKFRDTYGLPISTILGVARGKGIAEADLAVDRRVFDRLMAEQKERSRTSSKMLGDVFVDMEMDLNVEKTRFFGYETMSVDTARVVRLFKGTEVVESAGAGDEITVVLDRTPFYAESGGQVGDTGTMSGCNGTDFLAEVRGTRKNADVFLHHATVVRGAVQTGMTVRAAVDEARRLAIMRHHTATHLLQAGLRHVLGGHVQQQGSHVDEARLRFDFTHPKALTSVEIAGIEAFVSGVIIRCLPVDKKEMTIAEARDKGALAFFAEKYGDRVRVVTINGVSSELCGGTHLDVTGQMGMFKIVSEGAIAQGIRRIEAVVGEPARAFVEARIRMLLEAAGQLKVAPEELSARVAGLLQQVKASEKQIAQLRFDVFSRGLEEIVKGAREVGGVKIVTHRFEQGDGALLRQLADVVKNKYQAVVVFGSVAAEGASLVVSVSDRVAGQGVSAAEIIKVVAPLIGGSGGGRPQFAQAGGRDTARLDAALAEAARVAVERVAGVRETS